MSSRWRINVLGILTVQGRGHHISRFRTTKTGALLGYLAHELRPHSREALCTLIWPEADIRNGRNSLSVALSSLRTQLEPPGVEFGSVLIADRNLIALNPDAVITDVAEFRSHLAAANAAAGRVSNPEAAVSRQISHLEKAVDLYRGRFLEGLYDDWILDEGQRLEEQLLGALDRLIALLHNTKQYAAMHRYAEKSVTVAPWREAGRRDLIRALAASGHPESALRYYRHWQESIECEAPSLALRTLIAEIEADVARQHHRAQDSVPAATSSGPGLRPDSQLLSEPLSPHPTPDVSRESATPGAAAPSPLPLPLPLRRTRFFGRRVQLQRLIEQLSRPELVSNGRTQAAGIGNSENPRLVTLTGMGGSGKTRLALEAAHQLWRHYGGRLWFVGLTHLTAPSLLDVALRDALQIPANPQVAPREQVVEFLAGAAGLLVLDNFEPLLPAGAAWLAMLQARLPALTCLVTSRQRLDVEGEKEIVVRPLPVPRQDAAPNLERLLRYAGIQLFVDRACAARPDFGLTKRNAEAVKQLCHALEGVPLALELAAARSSALSPGQMLEQWEMRADLLQSSRRDLPMRHRSMQAAIEASYNLLPTEIQQFFKYQWVFRGGWTPEAAAQVCDEPRALHFAVQLRACSLLYQQERVDMVRFTSLETLRDFAGAQLTGAEREALFERHALYFLGQAQSDFASRAQIRQPRHIARMVADLDNYRAALERCHRTHPILALRLAGALWPCWEATSNLEEGRAHLEQALQAAPDAPKPLRAQATLGAGRLAYHQDFEISQLLLEKALALFRELEDELGIAATLCPLSKILINRHDPRAGEYAGEALAVARRWGDSILEAEATYSLGAMALGTGDLENARGIVEACVASNRKTGNRRDLAESLDMRGMTLWGMGQWERARASFEESYTLACELGWRFMEAHALWGIAAVARAQGDIPRALAVARESLRLMAQGHFHWMIPYCLANLAHARLDNGQVENAVLLLGAAEAQHEALGTPLMPLFFPTYDHYLAKARAALSQSQFQRLWEQGKALAFEDAVAFALQ